VGAQIKPELFFALVGPVGADLGSLQRALTKELATLDYELCPTPHRLIELLFKLNAWTKLKKVASADPSKRYPPLMDAGNEFRTRIKRADAMALFAAADIWANERKRRDDPLPGRAHIFRSLKRPEEVETLRSIYGSALVVVAAYAPPEARRDAISAEIAQKEGGRAEDYFAQAEQLIARDRDEAEVEYGQRLSMTFPLADVFLDVSDKRKLRANTRRFIELLFGNPFRTPSREEYAMFQAHGAALRSADLSRLVGAAITSSDGEVIALGTNEVPKPGGGLYWEGDDPDARDFNLEQDTSRELKIRALAQILERVGKPPHSLIKGRSPNYQELARGMWRTLDGTDIASVTEWGRTVHAEMAAITDAARRGVPLQGTVMYTTTFPCHNCARHIVAAGIRRVIFVEPYPKSLARDLHMDAITVEGEDEWPRNVNFSQFVGVGPRMYRTLFTPIPDSRRNRDGTPSTWTEAIASSRVGDAPAAYVRNEFGARTDLLELLKDSGLQLAKGETI